MSINYRIEDKLVSVTVHGVSSAADVRTAFKDITTAPDLHLPARILFDARNTDYAPPDDELGARTS